MPDMTKYNGIIPAFYACYDAQGQISTERTCALASFYVAKGVKGLYICGSSGECIYQSKEERKKTLEAVMSVAKGKITIIAHVACNNTSDSKELAAHAESLGVDAIAAIPPIYFRLPEHAIAQYWNDISSAAPNTDFIIYNIPQLAGVSLTMPLFREMLKNPKVIGVKNSSAPTQDIQMFKAEGGPNFVVLNGPDEQFIAGRAIGADGGIGGTYGVMPELFLKADALFKAGRIADAQAVQFDICEVIYAMLAFRGNLYAVIKEILRIRENIDIGTARKPLPDISADEIPAIKKLASKIDAAIAKASAL